MSEQPSIRSDFFQLIDGELVQSPAALEVINPANEEVFARAPDASRGQLDHAVAAARLAFEAWSRRSYEERATLLRRLGETLRTQQDSLAELLTREQGKPLGQARDEIGRAFSQSEGMTRIAIEPEVLVEDAQR